jgi:hypothetical protein
VRAYVRANGEANGEEAIAVSSTFVPIIVSN